MPDQWSNSTGQPAVSVIMANHNGAAFLDAAIGSVLKQSLPALELLLVDDGSTDRSVEIMQRAASLDPRVRIHRTPTNLGPAGARNIALDHARGRWIAVVDSDDLLHPRRFEWLVAQAEADGADIAADDALVFEEHGAFAPHAMLGWGEARWIDPAHYIRNNALFRRGVALGYLKPIVRADAGPAGGLRYNPSLRIAEDYDLVARMLMAGSRLRVYPQLTYFYRKHAGSISHRLSAASLQAMLAADEATRLQPHGPDVMAALDSRRRSVVDALDFTMLIAALKARQPAALLRAAANPRALALLRYPVIGRIKRRRSREAAPKSGRDICVLTDRRLTRDADGASLGVLDLLGTVAGPQTRLHLVCPSPALFDTMPVLVLGPELSVFRSIRVRGAVRWRTLLIATGGGAWAAAAMAALGRVAGRTGAWLPSPVRANAGGSAGDADPVFVARHARPNADLLIAACASLTEAFPYALRPDAATAVVAHGATGAGRTQASPDGAEAWALEEYRRQLSQADCIIAADADEARQILHDLPGRRVLTVPPGTTPAAAATILQTLLGARPMERQDAA